MNVKDLVLLWEDHAQGKIAQDTYQVNLTLEDAAKIDALAEMYPRRSKEQILSELISASLGDLEKQFPYKQGSKVVSTDEMGDPIFEDVGPTPAFIYLTQKYMEKYRQSS